MSKKKIMQTDEGYQKRNNFNTMLQNIKNVIKENEKKEREAKI